MPAVTPSHVAVVDRQLCDACGLCMPLCPPLAMLHVGSIALDDAPGLGIEPDLDRLRALCRTPA